MGEMNMPVHNSDDDGEGSGVGCRTRFTHAQRWEDRGNGEGKQDHPLTPALKKATASPRAGPNEDDYGILVLLLLLLLLSAWA